MGGDDVHSSEGAAITMAGETPANQRTSVSNSGLPLEELTPGPRVVGAVGIGAVEVVAVRWHVANALTLTYRDDHGATGQQLVYRDHEPRLRLEAAGRWHVFDSDPASWRLAAEALRIRYAVLFDPMLAVATVT